MAKSVVNMEIKSELLCYLQNYFGNSSQKGLITTISGFYNSDEVSSAKSLLFSIYDGLLIDGHVFDSKHRLIQRKADDPLKKRELDTSDLVALYSDLDKAKAQLPTFMASNLQRVPPFTPDATDICSLSMNVSQLQAQMASLQQQLCCIVKATGSRDDTMVNICHSPSDTTGMTMATADVQGAAAPDTVLLGVAPLLNGGQQLSWADTAVIDNEKWTVITGAKKTVRPKPVIKVCGSRSLSDQVAKLKAVPRKKVLAAHVGRLQQDTTEEDLTNYLTDVGIKGVVCKKLVPKNGQIFRTSAFYVTCCDESKDLFYDESCWPEGVELRDWIYYNRK
jgi:hypothetical protein